MAQRSEKRAMHERTMPTRRYVEENAVREMEIESPIPREFEEQRRKNRKKRANQDSTEANRQRAKQYTLIQLGALALTVVGVLGFCVRYLQAQDEMDAHIREIAKLEQEYSDKLSENEGLKTRIDSEIDYNEIYRIATEELGMTYPQKHQEIQYDHAESEYVRQNDEIPRE